MGNLSFNVGLKKLTEDNSVLECNNLILDFIGESRYVDEYPEMCFHNSWDWIIPVCKFWDELYDGLVMPEEYIVLSDRLDNEITMYCIDQVYKQLIINIRWYNDYITRRH